MRLRSILTLPVAVTGLLVGLAVAGPIDSATAYPATTCPTLAVSTTSPLEGQSIGVTGTNFAPDASIKLYLKSPVFALKTVHSNGGGTFSTSVKMPKELSGNKIIYAVGGGAGAGAGCPADPVESIGIQSTGSGNGGNGGASGSNNGGTAFTGLDVVGLIAAALALLGGGVLLNRSGRRRRAYATRH